ncbi:MAG TPA: MFS transporter [Anaerolineae bacterium]|nr:MFS transporter [Anaerolineae bacterium]
MSLIKDRPFIAAAVAHFAVDALNGQRPLLLAVLSVPLGLSNTAIGLVTTLYTFSGSLSQPLFGWLADRIGPRWVATIGVLWMAGAFGLAVSLPNYAPLILLILASFGSGAFHPAGAMEATLRGRQFLSDRETTAASLFFFSGAAGYSFGPALGGPILDRWGPPGLILLLLFVVPAGMYVSLRFVPLEESVEKQIDDTMPRKASSLTQLIPFIFLTAFRSWTQTSMVSFIPKYYNDLGYRPSVYGVIVALLTAGSAIGGVIGGMLADRYGKRNVTLQTLFCAVIPLAIFPFLSDTAWVYILLPLAGALTGASHSILVVLAQRMMPGKTGTASGLILGFTFTCGALGTLISGFQADFSGFKIMFLTLAGITLIAAFLAFRLPKN